MTMRVPEEPILAAPVEVLPDAGSFEPKWDGFRAFVSRAADGAVDLRSRRGTRLVAAFGDIAVAAERDLPPGVVLDGEVVIWHDGRLAFDLLQQRMHRTAASAAREAREHPANFVAFDLLAENDQDLMALPYARRRARLEAFFAAHRLGPPWVLCPATTDRAEAEQWMRDWAAAGIEGLVVKDPIGRYRPGQRGWRKYKLRNSTEVLVGAVAGSLARPTTALFGRIDEGGALRFVGRSTTLNAHTRAVLASRVTAAAPDHPWHGRSFAAAWGSRERHPMIPVAPDLVAEVAVDAAFERGAWRHPMRLLRLREDLAPDDVPQFG